MFEKRLAIETHPNPQVRNYYVTGIVSNARIFSVDREDVGKRVLKSAYGIEADEETCKLINRLLENRAIDSVDLDETTVRVVLRIPFYWHEVQDDIIEAILDRLGWSNDETRIMSLNDFKILAREADRATMPDDIFGPAVHRTRT